jgi:transitional endoplasmic reticulum ATPase
VTKTAEQKKVVDMLEGLATVGGKLTAEEDITFEGTRLVLPERMSLKEAIKFLSDKREEEDRTVQFSRVFQYRPWDGARATWSVLKRAFGIVSQQTEVIQSFFGTQEIPPQLITIPTSTTETEQIPWGHMSLPHLAGLTLVLSGTRNKEYGQLFALQAEGPKRWRHHVQGIFNLVQWELEHNSLYRGKAIDGQEMAQFLDLTGVNPRSVVYAEETTRQLDANLWSLLRYSDKMEELGISLKRTILLEGPYGTGKTLAAFLTAQEAVATGWTFLLCRPGRDDFMTVMATARLYQPAVVFFEDVDTLADSTSDHVRELLDIVDGIQAKGTRIICVLTTNHVEQIHKGMVRPGRLDAIIHIGELDAAGLRRLVEVTVPEDLLSPSIDWNEVTESMSGYLPAFAKEAIERTVRYNVARNHGAVTKLDTDDFVAAAVGLRPQLELMEGAKDKKEANKLSDALSTVVAETMEGFALVRDDNKDHYVLKKENA